jgi:hypothetical protein
MIDGVQIQRQLSVNKMLDVSAIFFGDHDEIVMMMMPRLNSRASFTSLGRCGHVILLFSSKLCSSQCSHFS